MFFVKFCLSVCVVYNLFSLIQCFVYDVKNSVIINPQRVPPNHISHFGYSLDIVKENGKSWVLVGAPKDGDKPTGSLNSCSLDFQTSDSKCQVQAPNLSGAPKDDTFDDQLLGVSVLSVAPSGGDTEVVLTYQSSPSTRIYSLPSIRSASPLDSHLSVPQIAICPFV